MVCVALPAPDAELGAWTIGRRDWRPAPNGDGEPGDRHPFGAAGLLAGAEGHADHQTARTAHAEGEQEPGVPADGALHSGT